MVPNIVGLALSPFQASEGVEVPLVPVLVAVLAVLALFIISAGILRAPRPRGLPTERRKKRVEHATAEARPPPLPVAAPVYKKAPVTIELPQVPAKFPDVWGIREPLDIILRLSEPDLASHKSVPGFSLSIAGQPHVAVFLRGVTSIRKAFPQKGEPEIVVEYQAPGESLPRRTTRRVKVVDYREEIADVFHNFKQEASRAITPLREDATPWEIYDALTEAQQKLPRQLIRDIVSCFEEAKFSNHPVTRATYERMITALLQLERAEL